MNVGTELLFRLSKTDRRIIAHCSEVAHKTQAANGLFVLIVGIFAFFSASYALRTVFGPNKITYLVAAVYSTLIMLIDREIVSTTNKSKGMIATRLVLAVFIGLVVSVPLELRIFEKEVAQELKRIENSNNSPYLARKQEAEAQYRSRIVSKEQEIQKLNDDATQLQQRLTNEVLDKNKQFTGVVAGTGHPGIGPVYRRLNEQIKVHSDQLTKAQDELRELQANETQELDRIAAEYKQQEIPPADDLLARYVALGAVKQDPVHGWDAWTMAWGVRLLLIMLELTPALIKILQEENEYDALLQANRRRSITRIYAIANDHMEQLAENGGQNPTPTLLDQLNTEPLTS
jgi:cell division protein FtsB